MIGWRLMQSKIKAPVATTIVDQANLVDQWVASDVVAQESALVPSWRGRVNGIVAEQSSELRQPRYFAGVYGLPGLLFAGSTMNTPYIDTVQNITVYAKVLFSTAPTSTASTVICQDTGGNNRSWHFGVNNTSLSRFVNFTAGGVSGASVSLAGTVPINSWHGIQGQRRMNQDGTGQMQAFSGTASSTSTNIASTSEVTPLYLSIGSRGGFNEAMNGYIHEIRVYKTIHDAATRALVRAEMQI